MNIPETLKLWTVIRNTHNNVRAYWFGSYEEFLREECYNEDGHLWVEIPFEDWTPEDLAEVFENKIADANYHNWDWMPYTMLTSLYDNNVPEVECFNIILDMYRMFERTLVM